MMREFPRGSHGPIGPPDVMGRSRRELRATSEKADKACLVTEQKYLLPRLSYGCFGRGVIQTWRHAGFHCFTAGPAI
jgi:hypothetical protein